MFRLNATRGVAASHSRGPSRRPKSRRKGQRLAFQQLESRRLLAGDVGAEVADGTLLISGDDSSNSVRVDSIHRTRQDSIQVVPGNDDISSVTSVALDSEVLALAGLEIPGVSDKIVAVDFGITDPTDFRFTVDGGFAPVAGTIEHSGTVTLGFIGTEDAITIGDFSIGFDGTRAGDGASGFFVEDTVGGLGIVFDVGSPGLLDLGDSTLTIGDADLLVSPELASALGNSGLTGADAGDAQIDARTIDLQERRAKGGKTSVGLNVELLETAAGLKVTSLNGTATPASDVFQVAFKILRDSSFTFNQGEGLVPLGGRIEHVGTVGFNEDTDAPIVVGDFSIGFDPSRAINGLSGFFVEDTVGGLGVLFDVGAPGGAVIEEGVLQISEAPLAVSQDLAIALGNEALTGAVVGQAQIDAVTGKLVDEYIRVSGQRFFGNTSINGARSAEFLAADIENVIIDAGLGNDTVRVNRVSLPGDLSIDLGDGSRGSASVYGVHVDGMMSILGGDGRDRIRSIRSTSGSLNIETGDNSDNVYMLWSRVDGDANIDLGGGRDRLTSVLTRVGGTASIDGGSGYDRFDSYFSRYGDLEQEGIERRRLF